jgi:tetratricopeptide (TPR) repeat protein
MYGVLLATVALIYGRAVAYDFVNYGDPAYVSSNPHVRAGFTRDGLVWAFTSARDSGWIPLTWISHILDCQVFGLQSALHHLTSLVLHAISALLLFAVLKRITGARWPSAFVAFVFAAHPLQVETVAWIAERKDLLSGVFWMLTLCAYVRFVEQRSAARYGLVAAMFCCALLSSPMATTLPLALLLLDFWPLRRFSRDAVLEKIPLAALSIAAMIVALVTQKQPVDFQAAITSYVTSLWQFVVPINLSVVQPHAIGWWQGIGAGIVMLALTIAAVRFAASRPYLAMGWCWYLLTMLPGQHHYIPIIGISIALAWGASAIFDRATPMIAGASIAACCAWSGLAWVNVGYWQDSVTLFQHAAAVASNDYHAHTQLGDALMHEGQLDEALAHLEFAARIRPQDAEVQSSYGDGLAASGKIGDAIAHFQKAVQLDPNSPHAHTGVAAALMREGRVDDAAAEYRTALKIEPGRLDAEIGLAAALAAQGRTPESIPHLQSVLPYATELVRVKPDDAEAHYNLGRIDDLLGRKEDAIVEFSTAARLQPDNPERRYALGAALAEHHREPEAFGELATAVRLRPDDPQSRFRLADILFRLGRRAEAVSHMEHLVAAYPDYPGARETYERMHRVVFGN